ncbi:SIR2 family protein [Bosea caraganae]|uniref:SIR2 family protein n=1 Tax=Bosea caraganae TaxID=2763117 RepID=A0A370KZ76_9HYPH|nr:SIR2 family protein [Bosea caraganae]RDJ20288.1 SIR2 family protein [Bosea caraganae]RDJ23985.1 SIR2 family protein [Bosea caraganae]
MATRSQAREMELSPFDNDEQYVSLVDLMKRGRPLALVGAGASIPTGYPSWDQLLHQLNDELGKGGSTAPKLLSVLKELQDPAWQAEELYNSLGPERFDAFMGSTFGERRDVVEPHHTIAKLGFRHILTTNFEFCAEIAMERAMGTAPKRVDWSQVDQVHDFFADLSDPNAPSSIVYLHGHALAPQNIVLTESAYSRTYLREENRRRLMALFMTQPVVFIGFSMNDPDLSQIMREVLFSLPNPPLPAKKDAAKRHWRRHFAIFGYRTAPERDLIRRRMQGKYGLHTVFYRIEPTPDGQSYSHDNLLALLTALGNRGQTPPPRKEKDISIRVVASPQASRLPSTILASAPDITEQTDLFNLDPHKGRFGQASESDGLSLRVANVRRRRDYVEFDLVVKGSGKRRLRESVRFHYHPTFDPRSEVVEPSAQGEVRTTLRAVGAFTVGAITENTRLELDLAEDPRFPKWFRDS